MKRYKNIIIGAGITGLTLAERLASKGEKVLIMEKRNHIGGNCFDFFDKEGNYIQKYGPHIFHTKYKEVWDYLSKFTEWNNYEHKVIGKVKNKLVPIPFNFESIDILFNKEKAEHLKKILEKEYGLNKKVPILELKKNKNIEIKKLAEFAYENIFLNYTMKQWDLKPEEIDPSVTARVPVMVGYDNRYFQDKYQGIPSEGFTKIFQKMILNPLIEIRLGWDYKKIISNYKYDKLFYTGPLDYYFDYKFGKIKYRKISSKYKRINKTSYQSNSVINYPAKEEKFTRITEFNKFLNIKNHSTIIMKEYPSWKKGFQAYPLKTEKNQKIIDNYLNKTKKLIDVVFIGRLAECKYYNIDEVIKEVFKIIKNGK